MTPRVYDGITPRVCFQEVWAWFYDGIAPSFDLQTPLLPLASFFVFTLTPFAQRKENDTSPIAYKCLQTLKTHSLSKATCWVDTQPSPCAQYSPTTCKST
jgi:hypothetical protein